jgi:TolB-like protein
VQWYFDDYGARTEPEPRASAHSKNAAGRLIRPALAGVAAAFTALLAGLLWLNGIKPAWSPQQTDRHTEDSPHPAEPSYAGTTSIAGEKLPRIAVLPFEYLAPDAKDQPGLQAGVGRVMATRLEQSGLFDIVERARLEAVLAELDLSQSTRFDPAERNQIGKLLGARQLVLGSIFMFGQKLRMDASLVDTETGGILCSEASDGPPDDVEAITNALCDALIARNKKEN